MNPTVVRCVDRSSTGAAIIAASLACISVLSSSVLAQAPSFGAGDALSESERYATYRRLKLAQAVANGANPGVAAALRIRAAGYSEDARVQRELMKDLETWKSERIENATLGKIGAAIGVGKSSVDAGCAAGSFMGGAGAAVCGTWSAATSGTEALMAGADGEMGKAVSKGAQALGGAVGAAAGYARAAQQAGAASSAAIEQQEKLSSQLEALGAAGSSLDNSRKGDAEAAAVDGSVAVLTAADQKKGAAVVSGASSVDDALDHIADYKEMESLEKADGGQEDRIRAKAEEAAKRFEGSNDKLDSFVDSLEQGLDPDTERRIQELENQDPTLPQRLSADDQFAEERSSMREEIEENVRRARLEGDDSKRDLFNALADEYARAEPEPTKPISGDTPLGPDVVQQHALGSAEPSLHEKEQPPARSDGFIELSENESTELAPGWVRLDEEGDEESESEGALDGGTSDAVLGTSAERSESGNVPDPFEGLESSVEKSNGIDDALEAIAESGAVYTDVIASTLAAESHLGYGGLEGEIDSAVANYDSLAEKHREESAARLVETVSTVAAGVAAGVATAAVVDMAGNGYISPSAVPNQMQTLSAVPSSSHVDQAVGPSNCSTPSSCEVAKSCIREQIAEYDKAIQQTKRDCASGNCFSEHQQFIEATTQVRAENVRMLNMDCSSLRNLSTYKW